MSPKKSSGNQSEKPGQQNLFGMNVGGKEVSLDEVRAMLSGEASATGEDELEDDDEGDEELQALLAEEESVYDDEEDEDDSEDPLAGPSYYSVSEITEHLQAILEEDEIIGDVITVRGELSNVRPSSRGHLYFTLKDDKASLSGVMWASLAKSLKFDPEDGLDVFVTGTVEIYAPYGTYSIVTKKLEPVGLGTLQLAFQQLKEKLEKEGLFDAKHKKPLPEFPRRVGIITARTGAVIHDMLRVIRRKHPGAEVLLAPVKVQGDGAALQIADAVVELNRPEYGLDVLIVGRGGGSFEDLFCFSEEPVVRAIFNSRLPVIAGIGHEPDYGLADAVADYSASTPTAAAEKAVPDLAQLMKDTERRRESLLQSMLQHLLFWEQNLDQRSTRLIEIHERTLDGAQRLIEQYRERLASGMENSLQRFDQMLKRQASELEAFSPLKTLARGYAIATKKDGSVLLKKSQVASGDEIALRLSEGSVDCRVL